MNLEFISPILNEEAPAESPILSAARRSGALVDSRGGWLVPTSFGDEEAERRAIAETVGFADASALAKTELSASADVLHSLAGGLTLGTASRYRDAWWCPLTPTRALVLGSRPDMSNLSGVTAVDVTTQFCALRIAGPVTRQLISRFCALDLRLQAAPPGSLRPGSVARTPGLVVVEAADRMLVLVGAALAEYLWSVFADAAQRLGGRAVGSDVLAGAPTALQEVSKDA